MNKAKLKTYAPQARRDFIAAVTARAHLLGLHEAGGKVEVAPAERQGDVALIAGQAWPVRVLGQRDKLVQRMARDGFGQTLEAVAYTWFNRFAALRFMEIHDYLGHGQRVLTSREGGLPEILAASVDLARRGDLATLNAAKVEEMKLAGNQDGELYRLLLVAQCNTLASSMPFLFERIDDETELLLPDNLLRTDSVIAGLVGAIAEEDWAEVEIIGWLYQFYISEKKDAVIGKVVKSEDIPAATQLFTPNWIVQYLVQNSVGRLWLMANPASTLASQWPYYIEPAEQTPEVNAALAALTQARMDEDGGSLNPESITVLDPACGSGHILVEAYEVLKAIYLERGYRLRDIPRLILEKNLYGLDIDDRAAQMAGFALLMKARADDRRLLDGPLKLNVLSLQESKGLDEKDLTRTLSPFLLPLPPGEGRGEGVSSIQAGFASDDLFPATRPQIHLGESAATDKPQPVLISLIETFAHAKTFGSLIQIPPALKAALPALAEALQQALQSGDLYAREAAKDLLPLLEQAKVLAMQFDAVVANPPYMGGKFYNSILKIMIAQQYEKSKGDLYAAFLDRNIIYSKYAGFVAMITIPNWMFLSGFEDMRRALLAENTIETFCHNGRGVFGSDFGSCAFSIRNSANSNYKGVYKRLYEKQGSVASNEELSERFFLVNKFEVSADQFTKVPGLPLAYWVSERIRNVFYRSAPLIDSFQTRLGMSTADNERFLRYWHEVSLSSIAFNCKVYPPDNITSGKWFPYQKGGLFRKWYGNNSYVVNWENDGEQVKGNLDTSGRVRSHNYNGDFACREGVTWSDVTSGENAFRFMRSGFLFDGRGSAGFAISKELTMVVLGLLNSKVSFQCIAAINPTIAINVGEIGRIPFHTGVSSIQADVKDIVEEAIDISVADWDACEISWDFSTLDWCKGNLIYSSLEMSWGREKDAIDGRIGRMRVLEEKNNALFINAYELNSEFSPSVPEDQITLTRADREKDCQRLISYALGCMMGRYSLDEPGLIYAHAGNVGFTPDRYKTFPADADGIVPITDELWFEDDAAQRVREFLLAVWGPATLDENLAWLAESLGVKGGETPDETIRRYLAGKFYKDHLQTYKKRPIYWLFSSGKQGAFQALVYLHRYNDSTLARLRAEYVVPLTGKIQGRIAMLEKDRDAAPSAAARTRLGKQIETLKKQHLELLAYDEKLRHYADMRISLDLDDGVKVNYGKFGDLLAEVKAVTGGVED